MEMKSDLLILGGSDIGVSSSNILVRLQLNDHGVGTGRWHRPVGVQAHNTAAAVLPH